jgi:hypothetical protein
LSRSTQQAGASAPADCACRAAKKGKIAAFDAEKIRKTLKVG